MSPRPRPRAVRRTIVAGLCVAVIGGTVIAAVETAAATWVVSRHLQDESLPIGLIPPALGRAVVTHLLAWCPMMVALALAISALRRRAAAAPEPFLWAIFVLGAGLVVVPADLALANHKGRLTLIVAWAAVVVLAFVTYVVVKVVRRRLGPPRFARIRSIAACVCALLAVVSGTTLVRSPLSGAAGYRVGPPTAASASSSRPNVLWIVLDTVRADRMSCHGYDTATTPFIDEWAKQAIVCEQVVANGMWTVPSHASMFTGLSARQHGARHGHVWLDDAATTVAEVLGANGYLTASFSNNPLLSPSTNLLQDFHIRRALYEFRLLESFSLGFFCERWGVTPLLPWLDGDYGAALTNHLVARWLDRRPEAGRPFLLFINYMETHLPYRVPKRYRRMYLTEEQVHRSYDLRWRVFGDIHHALQRRFNIEGGEFVTPADREIIKGQYLAAVRYLDDRTREMVEIFDQRGLLDNTLVVITSDHGEYLGTHGMWGHRCLIYNDLTHVPLMIREPGRTEGVRLSVPVQLSDLYPTVVNWALGRSDPGPGYDSRDLLALARAGQGTRLVVSEYDGRDTQPLGRELRRRDPVVDHRATPQTAVTDGRLKYIVSRGGQRELYDIVADPGELHNLITSRPSQAQRFADHLRTWRKAVPKYTPAGAGAVPETSADLRRALRALGYLDGE